MLAQAAFWHLFLSTHFALEMSASWFKLSLGLEEILPYDVLPVLGLLESLLRLLEGLLAFLGLGEENEQFGTLDVFHERVDLFEHLELDEEAGRLFEQTRFLIQLGGL